MGTRGVKLVLPKTISGKSNEEVRSPNSKNEDLLPKASWKDSKMMRKGKMQKRSLA
jgi:hypothetical protein